MRIRIALLLVALATYVPAARGQQTATHLTRIRLLFDDDQTVTPAMQRAAKTEAATLWRPYGVLVDVDEGSCDATLTVGVVTEAIGGGLGAVSFSADGIPQPHIALHYRAIVGLATSTTAFGIEPREWPVRLRDRVIARAVGRTLAHEMGHYLLRSPHHAKSGLMQARQRAAALAAPDRSAFSLAAPELARLRVVMAAAPRHPDDASVMNASAIPDPPSCS